MADEKEMTPEEIELEMRRVDAERRLEAIAEKRAAREKPAKLKAIEKLEREAQEEEAIEDAVAEYGEVDKGIKVVRYSGESEGIVIVKKPPYVSVKAFHDRGKFTVEAKDKLGRPHVVYPSKEQYNRLAAESVALVVAVADAAAFLAGFTRTELAEKSEP